MLLMLLVVLLFDWKIDTLLHIILEIHLLCVFLHYQIVVTSTILIHFLMNKTHHQLT